MPLSTIPGVRDSVDVAPAEVRLPGFLPTSLRDYIVAGRQYSMIRVTYGVIPSVRTGLTMTLPAMLDASSI